MELNPGHAIAGHRHVSQAVLAECTACLALDVPNCFQWEVLQNGILTLF